MGIVLGSRVKDKITGFTGIMVATTTHLNGCNRVGVQPIKLKDGIPQDPVWLDEMDVEVVKKNEKVKGFDKTGGPRPDPPPRTR